MLQQAVMFAMLLLLLLLLLLLAVSAPHFCEGFSIRDNLIHGHHHHHNHHHSGGVPLHFVIPNTSPILRKHHHYYSTIHIHGSYSPSTTQLYSIPDPIDVVTSGLASICRLPNGVTVDTVTIGDNNQQVQPCRLQQLYDVENSYTCRVVRERMTELDLMVEQVIPACTNSRVFTDPNYPYALTPGTIIPRLVCIDNMDQQQRILSGKEEILDYLNSKYDTRATTTNTVVSSTENQRGIMILRGIGGRLATLLRVGRGTRVSPAAQPDPQTPRPEKSLILYSYENNQFCRLVREVLTELDLPYELRNAGKLSFRRDELAETTGGTTQCPYILDPNRDTALAESTDICTYLYQHYARYTPPNELLQWISTVILPLARPVFALEVPLQAGSYNADTSQYESAITEAQSMIETTVRKDPVVVYTYEWSPFSAETITLLQRLGIEYKEISLGKEWIPGLMVENGAELRAALLQMTGQSSLPHIFIGGTSIGGLYTGTPGLLPLLEQTKLLTMIETAQSSLQSQKTIN